MVQGTSGEWLEVLQPLDVERLRAPLQQALADGLASVAVVLLHSYIFPRHEQQIGRLCRELGFEHISLSSTIMPMVKLVPRGQTTCVDAYLTPLITKYVSGFRAGFDASFDKYVAPRCTALHCTALYARHSVLADLAVRATQRRCVVHDERRRPVSDGAL